MSDKHSSLLRPHTQVLTRGFDPSLSVGSARPAVFRSSTYVFSSPEAAERAFDLMAGRAQPLPDEQPDLVYSRFNHPNAEILEDQIVPLETGCCPISASNRLVLPTPLRPSTQVTLPGSAESDTPRNAWAAP